MRTGQRFYPHLIRTIWATEYLTATQDFTRRGDDAGDTVAVVMKTYYEWCTKTTTPKPRPFSARRCTRAERLGLRGHGHGDASHRRRIWTRVPPRPRRPEAVHA